MMRAARWHRVGEGVAVLLALTLLSLGVTWPAALRLGSAGVGDAGHPLFNGDIFVSWVLEHSFTHGNILRWFHTDRVNFPVGEQLSASIVHSLNPYLSFPFYALFRPLAAHNLVSLLVLVLNGGAGYLAGRALLRSRGAAAVTAVLMAFSPYTLLKIGMGSIHKSLVAFLPLALWGLVALSQQPSAARVVLAALGLQLVYQQYPLYGLYALLCVPFVMAWDLWQRRRVAALLPWAALGVVFLGLTWASDLLLGLSGTFGNLAFSWSAPALPDANGYFDLLHPLRFELPAPTGLPIGLSAVALLALGAVALRRPGPPRVWMALVLAFTVLSAGPYLMLGADPLLVRGHPVPLPYWIIEFLTPQTYGRPLVFPLRCQAVVATALALGSGAFVAWVGAALPRRRRALWAAGFLALYGAECFLRFPEIFPVPVVQADSPSFFADIAGEDGGALLHLPIARRDQRGLSHRFCFLSAVADKPMMNAHEAGSPVVVQFPLDSDEPTRRARALTDLARADVRWIVLHRALMTGGQPPLDLAQYDWLLAACGPPVFDAEGVVVYRVPVE
ncbi:MAG: hypothetical protein ABIO70_19000 [Pseudomonadota bacterium]